MCFPFFSLSYFYVYSLHTLALARTSSAFNFYLLKKIFFSFFFPEFRQAIRHPSSAGDDESDSKFEHIRNQKVARTLFLGFSWLKPSLPSFLLLIPLTPESCWKSGRVVVSLLQTPAGISADRSSLFHLPRANSPYASTLLEVRQSVGFLASFFCRRLLEFRQTEAGFPSFSPAGCPADCLSRIHLGNSIPGTFTSLASEKLKFSGHSRYCIVNILFGVLSAVRRNK